MAELLRSPRAPVQAPPDPLSETIVLSLLQSFSQSASESPLGDIRASEKRRSPLLEDGATSDDSGTSDGRAKRPRKQHRQRKPSHVMIREEQQRLRDELEYLEARAALLRKQAGIPDPAEVAKTKSMALENAAMRDAIEAQNRLVANAQTVFSAFVNSHSHNPLAGFVRLGKVYEDRRATVQGLKDEKLLLANRFIRERTRALDPRAMLHEENGFVTSEGDYIVTQLDIAHFHGLTSVKQAFEALQFYFLNLEITNSELSGEITIREDTNMDTPDQSILVHRLVTMLSNGALIEKNALKFFEFRDDNGDEESPYGLVAAVPVSQDDLYPYSPSDRFRKDISAVLKLSGIKQKRAGTDQEELVVVLTKWFHVQLYRSDLSLPNHVLQDIRRSMGSFTNNAVTSMNQTLYGLDSSP